MNSVQTPSPAMPGQEAQMLPLRDIKLPSEPGFWPLAPGWWLLLILLSLVLIWLAIKWYRYHQKKRRWLAINEQLSALEFAYKKDQDKRQLLTEISVFLRRFVKYQLRQDQATTLVGEQWIAYLNLYDPKQPFAAYLSALTAGVYQADCDYDAEGLLHTTRAFIKQQVMHPTPITAAGQQEPQHV